MSNAYDEWKAWFKTAAPGWDGVADVLCELGRTEPDEAQAKSGTMSDRYVIREGLERGKGRYYADDLMLMGEHVWSDNAKYAEKIDGRLMAVEARSKVAVPCRIVRLVPKRAETVERDRLLGEAETMLDRIAGGLPVWRAEAKLWIAAHDKLRGGK